MPDGKFTKNTRVLSIAAARMSTPKTTLSCLRTRSSCCSNRTLISISMCKECAGRRNGSHGIDTEDWSFSGSEKMGSVPYEEVGWNVGWKVLREFKEAPPYVTGGL